ncbi:MAG: glutathione S-transferase [Acetobacteraceae bacterium]|jgi:glutathione S-transferase|nr:glutathione S-transferase [Acetobacteraceae bacterium]
MTVAGATHALISFAPMIDSELSRLVLAHYAVAYQEERHLFGVASLVALARAAQIQIPVLCGGGLRLAGPRAMVDWFDQTCPAERKLLPSVQPLRSQVEADWARFHGRLATETAAFAYFHLLPHPNIMMEPLCQGLPPTQATALRSWAYPPMRQLLTLLLGLSAARAADALVRIRIGFDYVDKLLADGRRHIAGERLTLSDFALASAVAPLLLPAGYGAPTPALETMPNAIASVIAELRTHPTAAFVQRFYAGHPPSVQARPR